MFLWFLAMSFASVLLVFDSVALDYRLIMVGSLVPWLDFLWGPPWPLHSIFFPVALMTAVMVLGWGRRLRQRRWLGLAIGVFAHLLLAATWTSRELFWWPFGGDTSSARPAVPSAVVAVALELAGLVVAAWLWHRLGLADRTRRSSLVQRGRVDRAALRP